MFVSFANVYLPHQNDKFVGQSRVLRKIMSLANPAIEDESDRNIIVLAGLGGAGFVFSSLVLLPLTLCRKSEIARELTRMLRNSSPMAYISRLNGSTEETLKRDFRDILRLPQSEAANQHPPDPRLVKAWLESTNAPPWLLIIDNARVDTIFGQDKLHRLLPKSAKGRILILSRNRKLAQCFTPPAHAIDVDGMEPHDARHLLLSFIPSTTASTKQVDRIVSAVGFLPLGVIQAGTYMSTRNISVNDYHSSLTRGDGSSSELLLNSLTLSQPAYVEESRKFSPIVCLEELRSQNPGAVILLAAIACLSTQGIPQSSVSSLLESEENRKALALLKSYSLIKPGLIQETYDINALVRTLVRSKLSSLPEFRSSIRPLLEMLRREFPQSFKSLGALRKGRSQSDHVESAIGTLIQQCLEQEFPNEDLASFIALISCFSYLQRELGSYFKIKATIQKTLNWAPQSISSTIEISRNLRNHLAVAEHCLGNFSRAAFISEDILFAQPTFHANEDRETIRAINTLALSHQSRGELSQATGYHIQAYSMKNRILGGDHPDSLITLNNLGLCLQSQGKHIAAEGLFRQVLSERRQRLEPDNPAIFRSMNNLATSLQLQKRFREAEHLLKAALAGKRRAFGHDHHETLRSKSNLAAVLHYQKKTRKAEKIFREIAAAFEEKLGSDHPETLAAYENLASFLRDDSRYQEAESIIREILPRMEEKYGERHAKTMGTMSHLAILLHRQGKYAEALEYAIRIRDVRKEDLGVSHRETQSTMQHIRQLEYYLRPDEEKPALSMALSHADEKAPHPVGRSRTRRPERPRLYRHLPLLVTVPHVLGLFVLIGVLGLKLYWS